MATTIACPFDGTIHPRLDDPVEPVVCTHCGAQIHAYDWERALDTLPKSASNEDGYFTPDGPVIHLFGGPYDSWLFEWDPDTAIAYGLAQIGGISNGAEYGSVSYDDISTIRIPPFNLPIEVDLHWTKTIAETVFAVTSQPLVDGTSK